MNPVMLAYSVAPATLLLLAAIAVVSGIALYSRPGWIDSLILRPCGLTQRGDYLTLLTCGFIHADLGHLLFNAFTLWSFGPGLERHLGTPAFALLYATGLLGSSLATWWIHRRQAGYASLGASGAILAVLFASIVVHPKSSIYVMLIPLPIPAPWFALAYLGFSVLASRSRSGRVNHDAHIAGAVVGLAFMAVTEPGLIAQALRVVLN